MMVTLINSDNSEVEGLPFGGSSTLDVGLVRWHGGLALLSAVSKSGEVTANKTNVVEQK
jgi:hypothetical protein